MECAVPSWTLQTSIWQPLPPERDVRGVWEVLSQKWLPSANQHKDDQRIRLAFPRRSVNTSLDIKLATSHYTWPSLAEFQAKALRFLWQGSAMGFLCEQGTFGGSSKAATPMVPAKALQGSRWLWPKWLSLGWEAESELRASQKISSSLEICCRIPSFQMFRIFKDFLWLIYIYTWYIITSSMETKSQDFSRHYLQLSSWGGTIIGFGLHAKDHHTKLLLSWLPSLRWPTVG